MILLNGLRKRFHFGLGEFQLLLGRLQLSLKGDNLLMGVRLRQEGGSGFGTGGATWNGAGDGGQTVDGAGGARLVTGGCRRCCGPVTPVWTW